MTRPTETVMATTQMKDELAGVITSLSPLENGLIGVHPRLHGEAAWWESMRTQLDAEPWAGLWARVKRVAEGELKRAIPAAYVGDRWWGSRLPVIAMAYRFTGNQRFLDLARAQMLTQAAQLDRDSGLSGGHVLYGTAVAYDWLYHDLAEHERALIRNGLHHRGSAMYRALNDTGAWHSTIYTCNHFPVNLAGLVAAGSAIYGEAPDVAAWLRLGVEKARLTKQALGPDGASQEGIGYGQYYLEFYLELLDLLCSLVGEDLFKDHEFLQNTATFHLYSAQGRNSWTEREWLICLGDGVRYAWYGPDYMMRKLASEYRDGVAQWFAEETHASGVTRDQAPHLALLWHDETIKPMHARTLPTMHHFKDLDVVMGRSTWDGDENVYAFKCGPHFGHYALKHYTHDIGGGHMHPDAGHLVIIAQGDALLADDGYTFKTTHLHNTAIVNGVGQTGEGTEWFEGLELRREKRGPRILSATHSPSEDVIIADVAPAYEHIAGLRKFVRRVKFTRPGVWTVVDEFEADRDSTFELFWHTAFQFEAMGDRAFLVRGTKNAMRLTTLAPEAITSRTFTQAVFHADRTTRQPDLGTLVIANATKLRQATFVTVIEVQAAGKPWKTSPPAVTSPME